MTTSGRPEILALIPARGGSKSIPRKNLLRLNGLPLIAYSIAHALGSRHVTRTIVSTDDEEIARVAREYGAEVPFMRPAELARDDSPDLDVFRHALTTLREREGYACACVVHLRPTGPVRRITRIDEAIELFLDHPEADSLRSVTPPLQSPYKMWREHRGYLEPVATLSGRVEAHSQARQSLPPVWWQNGYIDIVRPHVVLDLGLMAGHRILPFVMNEPVFELDYPENVARVEAALANQEAAHDAAPPRHPV